MKVEHMRIKGSLFGILKAQSTLLLKHSDCIKGIYHFQGKGQALNHLMHTLYWVRECIKDSIGTFKSGLF